jgi:tetratricopeptide (TPR) repeat protein
LQQLGRVDAALALATEAVEIFERDSSPLSRWRCARALERVAELTQTTTGVAAALPIYRQVVELYRGVDRRHMPVSASLDKIRAQRVLAEKYVEVSDSEAAFFAAKQAVEELVEFAKFSRPQDSTEIATTLGRFAEIAVMYDPDTAAQIISNIRLQAKEVYNLKGPTSTLERRLLLAEARLLERQGRSSDALSTLEGLSAEDNTSASALELRAEALLNLNRADEAITILESALSDTARPAGPALFELFRRALAATGHKTALFRVLLGRLASSTDRPESEALAKLLSEFLTHGHGSDDMKAFLDGFMTVKRRTSNFKAVD